jgi:hypothetical protein
MYCVCSPLVSKEFPTTTFIGFTFYPFGRSHWCKHIRLQVRGTKSSHYTSSRKSIIWKEIGLETNRAQYKPTTLIVLLLRQYAEVLPTLSHSTNKILFTKWWTVRVILSKTMNWTGHVVRMQETRRAHDYCP